MRNEAQKRVNRVPIRAPLPLAVALIFKGRESARSKPAFSTNCLGQFGEAVPNEVRLTPIVRRGIPGAFYATTAFLVLNNAKGDIRP